MKTKKSATIAVLAVMFFGAQLFGQVVPSPPGPNPAAIEGPINSITRNSDRSLELKVMNMTVKVPFGVPITTPTATLTPEQAADTTSFPGRDKPGFVGGTAIVANGQFDASGAITASDLFLEPAENVVLGVVTANGPGQLLVNNVPVSLIDDARMPASPPKNVFGFEILLSSVQVGASASVEGYFANGTFYAFLLEIDGNAQVKNPNPQIVINRAESRERTPNNQRGDEVEVRGAITTTHLAPGVNTQNVTVWRVDNGIERSLGTTTATVDPATPGFAEWRFKVTTQPTANAVLGRAPTLIRAKMRVGGVDVVTEFVPTLIL